MISQSHTDPTNAVGKITSSAGCTASCTENALSNMELCDNKGSVQIQFQMDNDPGTWVVADIPPPPLCNTQPCCSIYIDSNITIYLVVDDAGVELAYPSRDPNSSLLGFGIAAIVFGILFFIVCAMTMFYQRNKTLYEKV